MYLFLIGTYHGHVYCLIHYVIDKLCHLMGNTSIIVNQLANGLSPTRNSRGKFIINSQKIKYANDQLQLGLINVNEFLNSVSYSVVSYEEKLRRFSLHITSDEEQEGKVYFSS